MTNAERKTRAYSVEGAGPARLQFRSRNRGYRNENNCEQVEFLRFDRTDGPESGSWTIEWEERGAECVCDRTAFITNRYSDAAEPDESWDLFQRFENGVRSC